MSLVTNSSAIPSVEVIQTVANMDDLLSSTLDSARQNKEPVEELRREFKQIIESSGAIESRATEEIRRIFDNQIQKYYHVDDESLKNRIWTNVSPKAVKYLTEIIRDEILPEVLKVLTWDYMYNKLLLSEDDEDISMYRNILLGNFKEKLDTQMMNHVLMSKHRGFFIDRIIYDIQEFLVYEAPSVYIKHAVVKDLEFSKQLISDRKKTLLYPGEKVETMSQKNGSSFNAPSLTQILALSFSALLIISQILQGINQVR